MNDPTKQKYILIFVFFFRIAVARGYNSIYKVIFNIMKNNTIDRYLNNNWTFNSICNSRMPHAKPMVKPFDYYDDFGALARTKLMHQ